MGVIYRLTDQVMDQLISKHATRLLKLRVDEIEVKARIASHDDPTGKASWGVSVFSTWLGIVNGYVSRENRGRGNCSLLVDVRDGPRKRWVC